MEAICYSLFGAIDIAVKIAILVIGSRDLRYFHTRCNLDPHERCNLDWTVGLQNLRHRTVELPDPALHTKDPFSLKIKTNPNPLGKTPRALLLCSFQPLWASHSVLCTSDPHSSNRTPCPCSTGFDLTDLHTYYKIYWYKNVKYCKAKYL